MTTKTDFKQTITNQIIDALENNKTPWEKPWENIKFDSNIPYNLVSKNNYRGLNIFILTIGDFANKFKSNAYLTFKQATGLGGNVKKGAVGTTIFYYGRALNKREGEDKNKSFQFLKTYTVFNIEQCENIKDIDYKVKENDDFEFTSEATNVGHKLISNYIQNGQIILKHGGNRACYIRVIDKIMMPQIDQFKTQEDYVVTLIHECVHSTMHKRRLDRKVEIGTKKENYALEELVAEIGTYLLVMQLGIKGTTQQHESYIKSWLSHLKNDKNFIFKAAAYSSKAFDFIIDNSQDFTNEQDKEENKEQAA